MSSGILFNGFSPAVLNHAGVTAFAASVTGSGSEFVQDGIWSGGAGNLNLKFGVGNHAPGTASGVNFLTFSAPALNGASQVAFRAILTGTGVTNANDQGIWSEGSGALDLIAREGSPAPGTPSGVNFAGFDSPVLNSAGQVAIDVAVSGTGVEDTNNTGIWSGSAGDLDLVIREASHAPGTPSGARFSDFRSLTLNSAGQIAFAATLYRPVPDRNGNLPPGDFGGVDTTNDNGIWAADAGGSLTLIAREGDLLEVAPADFRTISTLDFFGGTGNGDGVASGFNDIGQLAFLATFTDGSSGVFVSSLAAVPEPASALLLLIGLMAMCPRRRALAS
jgi:hypothetical protein